MIINTITGVGLQWNLILVRDIKAHKERVDANDCEMTVRKLVILS